MKIAEIYESVQQEYEAGRDTENPMPLSMSAEDPLFLQWGDFTDDVEGKLLDKEVGPNRNPREYKQLIQKVREKYGQKLTVDPSTLISTEPMLDSKHLQTLMSGAVVQSSTYMPIVYKMGKNLIVGDGNHRIIADYLKKRKSTVLMLDLDALAKIV